MGDFNAKLNRILDLRMNGERWKEMKSYLACYQLKIGGILDMLEDSIGQDGKPRTVTIANSIDHICIGQKCSKMLLHSRN